MGLASGLEPWVVWWQGCSQRHGMGWLGNHGWTLALLDVAADSLWLLPGPPAAAAAPKRMLTGSCMFSPLAPHLESWAGLSHCLGQGLCPSPASGLGGGASHPPRSTQWVHPPHKKRAAQNDSCLPVSS